jgi:hypothetical protein
MPLDPKSQIKYSTRIFGTFLDQIPPKIDRSDILGSLLGKIKISVIPKYISEHHFEMIKNQRCSKSDATKNIKNTLKFHFQNENFQKL